MVAGIPDNILPLMKPFTNRVDESIKPGLTMLNWTSLNVHSCKYLGRPKFSTQQLNVAHSEKQKRQGRRSVVKLGSNASH